VNERHRPTVGLACAYFAMFDAQMPPDWRVRQAAVAERSAQELGAHFDVVAPGLIASPQDAAAANARFRQTGVDCVVLAPTMAAPPSLGELVLEGLDVPVVVWNAQRFSRLGSDLDQVQAHVHTTLLGSVMHANALRRRGAPFLVVTTSPDDPAGPGRLARAVRAACVVRALRSGPVLRIGRPIEGYVDVDVTADQLAGLGLALRDLDGAALADEMDAVEEPALTAVGARAREVLGDEGDPRSLRLAAALHRVVERERPACAAVNCHSAEVRGSDRVGITACLGVSLCTAAGLGVACTGDAPTALAVAIALGLTGRGQYCEPYAVGLEAGTLLLGSAGEGDPGWARQGTLTVVANEHYPGVAGAGASLSYGFEPGPATLLSLSPVDEGWTMAWLEGAIVDEWHPRMAAPNGVLRIEGDPRSTLDRWIASGATHHGALAAGHVGASLRDVCRLLGIDGVDAGEGLR
jgi:L-arabinose isomerase